MGLDADTSRRGRLRAEVAMGAEETFPTTGRGFAGRGWG